MSPAEPVRVKPWLSLVGIGLDGWEGLAPMAQAAVADAELIVGGLRHLAMLPAAIRGERHAWPRPFDDGVAMILARRGAPVAVLASGDPFWFGVGATLARHVDVAEMTCWPQPSAFQWAAGRLGWALQQVACLSVHGRTIERVIPELAPGARLLVLSWDATTPRALAALLVARGFGPSPLTVLSDMGGATEQRRGGRADAWRDAEDSDLNVVAIDCVADTPGAGLARAAGRPDALFGHDGALTKREVRATVAALLAPRAGEHLWDVGAGSGAIAIEWLLADPANRATAFEARPDRRARIALNAQAFGVADRLTVAEAAPTAFAAIEDTPDAVFIGGGLTRTGLMADCRYRLRPHGRLVATSVTVEGDAMLAAALAQYGGTLRRVAVSRAEPLGAFAGWRALRPVTIWACPDDTGEEAGS